jgi:hypothetical protein
LIISHKNVHIQKMSELAPLIYCKCLASETLSLIKKIAKLAIKNENPKVNPLATLKPKIIGNY